jgi:hypothetical protein
MPNSRPSILKTLKKCSREAQACALLLMGLMAQAKPSWTTLATPEDEKCGTAAPGCSLKEQARAPALHFPGVFHGKNPCLLTI